MQSWQTAVAILTVGGVNYTVTHLANNSPGEGDKKLMHNNLQAAFLVIIISLFSTDYNTEYTIQNRTIIPMWL